MRQAIFLAVVLAAGAAHADGLSPRDTAAVHRRGAWSMGVLDPLAVGVGRSVEVRTHPLVFFVAPNAAARVALGSMWGWRWAGEAGLSVPTLAMRLLQGTLFPSWETSGRRIGWWLVPRAGALASRPVPKDAVLTVSADAAVGVPLSHDDTEPLGAPAVVDLLFAPVTTGVRCRAGGRYDRLLGILSERLRFRVGFDVFLHGAEPSPFTLRADAGIDIRVGRGGRLAVGVTWWNSDQHSRDPDTGERRRSNDFLPVADFIWSSR